MPFRSGFDCLWCGTPHVVRGPDDLEGWAQLCPACVGRAGENGFLRFRLRAALEERAAARTTDPDDWYLRRGRFARGPIHDTAFQAELDAAGRFVDALPIAGEILELAAESGWWSTLLASKGTLTVTDPSPTLLDRARDRLLAHGLRAHLHVLDPWAEPDRAVDAVFASRWLAGLPAGRRRSAFVLARRWLGSAGTFGFAAPADDGDGPIGADVLAGWHDDLTAAGFTTADVTTTGRWFVLGRASA